VDKVNIIYEDKNFLAVDKPSGLVIHSDGRTKEYSLADWIIENYPEVKDVGEPLTLSNGEVIDRPGIVHRLDRETSGVMLVAKNQEYFSYLKKQFQDRKVKKIYKAFVYGNIKNDRGVIDRSIGRSSKDFRLWSAQRGARGKLREAVTNYSVIHKKGNVSFLEIYPQTGRTHQIRVHLKAINHPVICDKLYAPKKDCILEFSRLALHSSSVIFYDMDEKERRFDASLPEDFKDALDVLEKDPKNNA